MLIQVDLDSPTVTVAGGDALRRSHGAGVTVTGGVRLRARITAIPIRDCALDAATRYGVPCDLSGDEFIIWHDLGMNSSSRGVRRDCVPQVVGTAPGL